MKAIQNNDFTEVAFTKKSGTDGTTDKLKTICPHTVVCGHKKIFQKLR
jgi:FKBP-type peptidyl-prolyl cis-trans isomerase 2